MVKTEKTQEIQAKANSLAEERILDILIPAVKKPSASSEEKDENSEAFQNQKTREWMKEKLKKGEMDDKMIEFDSNAQNNIGIQILGPLGMDDMGINISGNNGQYNA